MRAPPLLARTIVASALAGLPLLLPAGCAQDAPPAAGAAATTVPGVPLDSLHLVLARADAAADSVEQVLLPVALLTPAAEAALRRSSSAQQLARARTLGAHVTDGTTLDRLRADGTLVPLEDSADAWVLRELRHSLPYVTPDTHALLRAIGRRFQERLRALGLPPYRIEITSALRTPAAQSALRDTNLNAAAGRSTHEFGTSVDIAYSGYAAPAADAAAEPEAAVLVARRVRALALERVAARYARELQAVLGAVLQELQDEGAVMVTLERQQPVFHITVARRFAGS